MPTANILVLPRPSLYRQLFSAEADARLRGLGNVRFHGQEQDLSSAELAGIIGDFDIVISGWRSPRFTDEVLANATRLKLVAHSAGSVRFLIPDSALQQFDVTCVAAAMGHAVAEHALMFTMLLLRPIHRWDRAMKAGQEWVSIKSAAFGQELAGQRVGVIGAGHVGRCYVQLLRALNVDVWVYDPYLAPARASQMGVQLVGKLEDLLRNCRIVSLQAPATPETHHMLSAAELALLPDGAMLINTARSWCIDEAALLAELRSKRISAAIDVFDAEPLPPDSEFRTLDNVLLTPHAAAQTPECRFRQGSMTVDEVERFINNQPLQHRITPEFLAIMA